MLCKKDKKMFWQITKNKPVCPFCEYFYNFWLTLNCCCQMFFNILHTSLMLSFFTCGRAGVWNRIVVDSPLSLAPPLFFSWKFWELLTSNYSLFLSRCNDKIFDFDVVHFLNNVLNTLKLFKWVLFDIT